MDCNTDYITPILSSVPLQLLSYHGAVLRGTDIGQPRNLARGSRSNISANRGSLDSVTNGL